MHSAVLDQLADAVATDAPPEVYALLREIYPSLPLRDARLRMIEARRSPHPMPVPSPDDCAAHHAAVIDRLFPRTDDQASRKQIRSAAR